MKRPHLRFSHALVIATLSILASSSAVFAQVNYTLTGTLTLTSGMDPLGLNGKQVTATATISQTATPSSSSTTASSSTNTYSNVTVKLAGFDCSTSSAPPVSVTLTDNAGASDTLGISNCDLAGLAVVTASATIPDGNMITAVPASIPTTSLSSGTISFLLTGSSTPGSFTLSNATLVATGTPPPTVIPSLTTWTVPSAVVGSTTAATQDVTFATSPAIGAVSFKTSSTANWLTVSPLATNTSSKITITANPTGLTQAFNSATVILTYGQGLSTQILVTFNLTSASVTLTATPPSMTFNFTPGGAAPPTQVLAIGAGSATPVSAAVTSGNTWLSVSPSGGTTPANFTVSINTAGITSGPLNGNIQITASGATNSPLNIPVTLNVASTTLTVATTPLTFNFTTGGSAPGAQAVSITGTSGITFTAASATTSGGTWLSATPASGTVPGSISVMANITGLAAGTYNGSVTVASNGAAGSPAIIPVSLIVSAAGPTIAGVVSGASYATSGFSPGTIVTIFGNLIGPQTGVAFSVNSKGSLDSTLAGVTVSVGGTPAIPIFVQNGQVNVILPFTIGTGGQAPVTVTYNNLTTAAFNIPLTPADVQIFTANASGSGPGSILNQDFSVNTAANPAVAGSVIQIYGTGGGVLSPAVNAGDVAGDTLSNTDTCTATVNGEAATVIYSGSAPGLVFGVDQFNVQLPADVKSGSAKVVLTLGGSTSQSDVTVFVK